MENTINLIADKDYHSDHYLTAIKQLELEGVGKQLNLLRIDIEGVGKQIGALSIDTSERKQLEEQAMVMLHVYELAYNIYQEKLEKEKRKIIQEWFDTSPVLKKMEAEGTFRRTKKSSNG